MDIVSLPLFSLLERSFVNEFKMTAYSDRKILIVTKSDEVYGLGPLPDSKFYANDLELRPIPQLHKKNVERFVFGDRRVFILMENGDLFGWGDNGGNQLKIVPSCNEILEPTKITSLNGKQVIDITCGSSHTVILDSDKRVHYFGDKSKPINYNANVYAIGIASSANAAFYLTSKGEVYGKGYMQQQTDSDTVRSRRNGFVSSEFTDCDWVKINFLHNIKKIVGGKSHVMALNNDGMVFVWGDNQKLQLGQEYPERAEDVPVKVSCITEKIIDIAANYLSDICAAMTERFKIYVWGGYSGGRFPKPYLTLFTSFEEVFTYLSNPSMTYKGITFEKVKRNTSLETGTLESIFDVQEDSDLTITIEKRPIYVHKAILKARSKYFLAMFAHQWKENDNKVLEIDGYSYDSYKSFLLYLYTGDIDITAENVFVLSTIADKYADDALLELIEKKLDSSSIPTELVKVLRDIMKLASPNLEKLCNGMKMIVSSTSKNL